MKFLFETHAHTAESSPCSLVKAVDLVKEYKDNGYSGVIITDHVGDWGFSGVNGTWNHKIDRVINAYSRAKEAGDKVGLKVLFGMEIALNQPYRDYLLYGADAEFLYKNKNINEISLNHLHELTQKENALLFAAHPFRNLRTMPDPKYLDGAEVLNSNPRHDSHNDMALEWAEKNNLIQTAGSDYHEHGDISSGVLLNKCPEDIKEFVEILKSGDYELKV